MKQTTTGLLLTLLSFSAYQSKAQQKHTNPQNRSTMTTEQALSKQSTLTAQEKEYAIQFLKETQSGVAGVVKELGEAQLTFKPAADKWSIEECVKHIAAAEKKLWEMAAAALKQPANPEKRAAIKLTDKELVSAVQDRSQKSKTFEALEPVNSPYKTVAEALASFNHDREKLIAFVKNTRHDLRNHVLVLPMGTFDVYQFILLISAHSNRHMQQIEEVKANPAFPKH